MSDTHDHEDDGVSWRLVAFGACGLVLTFGGMAVGLWSQSLDKRLDDIAANQVKQWEVLNSRASLAPRLERIERETEDQEQRIRQLEQRTLWRK